MKKILIATNLFTLLAFYMYSCTSTGRLAATTEGSYTMKALPNYSSCYNCQVDDIHGETAEEFADVTARYRSTHWALYNEFAKNQLSTVNIPTANYKQDAEFADARSCWFSADTIKKFLCLVEKYASELNIPSSNLGMRFYYANYGKENAFNGEYGYRHTLYIVPTVYDEKAGSFIDFEARESARSGAIQPLGKFLDESSAGYHTQGLFMVAGSSGTVAVSTADNNTTRVSTNQGDLCPPGNSCNPTLQKIDFLHGSQYY